MLSINPNDLSERENYKFLIGSIVPRPIALITTQSKEGVVNIAPFSFFNIVTSNPPILAVGFQRKKGQLKDTARNIFDNKQAVIHIVDSFNVEDANQTAANLGIDESELEKTHFHLIPSTLVDVPAIKESQIRFEVSLYDSISIENNQEKTSDLLLLKVLQYHINEAIYENGRINPSQLNPIARMAGHDYSELGRLFTIPRPD
ncbi:flavin reductase family protein [Fundicoccus culcitae]|uniref:Flavin reductase family protein n=1 Tax=Fundicoccus culcitae TaxID=2969821 RepID=A0ABY5P6D7_9LACT|nr:flavin reductase family protein [Fundicoccus culcitae]UUX34299.1 flavin reductase family protein [Fundicoccus culcitae]